MVPRSGKVRELDAHFHALEAACRRVGAKVTHQRREVLRALVENGGHPDAQSLFRTVRERMPTISPDTVYRTLAFLEDHALVRRVQLSADRVRYEANRGQHHHFICTSCGEVLDFESSSLDAIELPESATALGVPSGRQLQVFGVCWECMRKMNEVAEDGG
jgi:Fur family transcriptional regulator, peroxide stress response regulator